jgi:hypothetical protein
MELVLTQQEIAPSAKPRHEFIFNNERLLNSNYKSTVEKNFINSSPKSVFGVRQHLKFKRFNMVSHMDVVLKLSIFVITLAVLF